MSRQQEKFDLAKLEGRVAVITGAGNFGIGWGLAKYAALNLHMHVALIDLHEATVEQAAADLRAMAPDLGILALACDVTSNGLSLRTINAQSPIDSERCLAQASAIPQKKNLGDCSPPISS